MFSLNFSGFHILVLVEQAIHRNTAYEGRAELPVALHSSLPPHELAVAAGQDCKIMVPGWCLFL